MQETREDIINLIVIGTIFFLLLGGSIVLLVSLFSKAKRSYFLEKQNMQQKFQQEILQAQLEIQENTFNNISREIHDNVGQLLSLAKVQLNIMDQSPDLDKTMLTDVKESVGKAMTDLRDIAKSLSGERMQQMGLLQTIEQEIARINRSNVLKILFTVTGEPCKLNGQKQLLVFRIVQEVFQNILKHADANAAEVLLQYRVDKLELIITDDGKGFDAEKTDTTGLGLQNIVSRAALINGQAIVTSKINEGTKIKLIIPYE